MKNNRIKKVYGPLVDFAVSVLEDDDFILAMKKFAEPEYDFELSSDAEHFLSALEAFNEDLNAE